MEIESPCFQDLRYFKWKLLLYQNALMKKPFVKGHELFCPYTDGSKYSCLGELSDKYKIDDYFEFFLEYHFETLNPTYLYWKQKVNPVYSSLDTKDVGYIPLSVNITEYYPFMGLSRSTDNATFIDGSPGYDTSNSWWYAIASYTNFPTETTIPGPCIGDGIGATKVYFWVRVPFRLSCSDQSHSSIFQYQFILAYIFLIV